MDNSRDRLLRTADELFKTRGYYRTGLETLIKNAGVSRSNFYYHFRSKQALLGEVLGLWLREIRVELLRPLENDSLSALARIEQVVEAMARRADRFGPAVGCPVLNLRIELAGAGTIDLPELDHFFDDFHQHVTRCLQQGIRRRELKRDIDPQEAALFIGATLCGSVLVSRNMGSSDPVIKCGRILVRLLKPVRSR